MSVWLAPLVVGAAVAGSVVAMLLVRRRAPEGGFFADTGRGTGVFGVLGTAFAVLLGFVILLGLQSYREATETAGQEAFVTTQLYQTAALLPEPAGSILRGDLVCYGRAVVGDEWRTMDGGEASPTVQRWLDEMATTLASVTPTGDRELVAYSQWFTQDAERREGRRGRLAEATGLVPPLVWVVLLIGAVLVIGYMLLFADPKERAGVQAAMIGSIAAVVALGLVVVGFVDTPYGDHSGGVRPSEMRRTLALFEQTTSPSYADLEIPCDERGR